MVNLLHKNVVTSLGNSQTYKENIEIQQKRDISYLQKVADVVKKSACFNPGLTSD